MIYWYISIFQKCVLFWIFLKSFPQCISECNNPGFVAIAYALGIPEYGFATDTQETAWMLALQCAALRSSGQKPRRAQSFGDLFPQTVLRYYTGDAIMAVSSKTYIIANAYVLGKKFMELHKERGVWC